MPAWTPCVSLHSDCYIGLMSGTSLDGVDGVLVEFESSGHPRVLAYASAPFPGPLRQELLALNSPDGSNELHRAALSGTALSRIYAQVVEQLLADSGYSRDKVIAIGAHGQTVRHQPQMHDGVGYTLQLQNPSWLAEHTGITVVADLRSRDIAAGGQGAPLVPAFHYGVFGCEDSVTAVLNIGGIANLSILPPRNKQQATITGFDCGPGNALMDWWCMQHTGQSYDDQGRWAASGHIQPALLELLLSEDFFLQPPPKSTGRDLFNPTWLTQQLTALPGPFQAADVQATLTAFTAQSCADALQRHGQDANRLLVCGGGALNTHLMQQLQHLLPHVCVESTNAHGMPPLQVEAAAFAWLARQCLHGHAGNLPSVTGARGPRILGAIYPA